MRCGFLQTSFTTTAELVQIITREHYLYTKVTFFCLFYFCFYVIAVYNVILLHKKKKFFFKGLFRNIFSNQWKKCSSVWEITKSSVICILLYRNNTWVKRRDFYLININDANNRNLISLFLCNENSLLFCVVSSRDFTRLIRVWINNLTVAFNRFSSTRWNVSLVNF